MWGGDLLCFSSLRTLSGVPAHLVPGDRPAETQEALETQIPIPEPKSSPGRPFFTPEAHQHPSPLEEPSSEWLCLLTLLCVGLPSLTAKVVTTVSLPSHVRDRPRHNPSGQRRGLLGVQGPGPTLLCSGPQTLCSTHCSNLQEVLRGPCTVAVLPPP